MSTFEQLVAALAARGAASEWVALARVRRVGSVRRGAASVERDDEQRTLSGLLHRDTVTGRGSAQLALSSDLRSLDSAVDDALARAAGAIGPAWRMAPAAASARVATADVALERGSTTAIAASVAAEVEPAAAAIGLTVEDVAAQVTRETVSLATSQGIEMRWRATEVAVRASVRLGDRVRAVDVVARRRSDLGIGRALDEAKRRMTALADASPTPRGAWPIALSTGALLAGGDLGLLAVFAAQADAATARLGLGRYRPGQPVAIGAVAIAEPLTVASDGALAFGPRSAPMADDGAPVRRFTLVDRGAGLGLALDHREAALRGLPPNGGVRNLVVGGGTTSREELLAAPVLEIDELSWIDLDARTGELSAAIGLGTLHEAARTGTVTGGVVRFDAVAALALARRSGTVVRRGAYVGPDLWRLPAATVD